MPPLTFRLLGVPVAVTCADPAMQEHLSLCYGSVLEAAPAPDAVEGVIRSNGNGHVVEVTGRPRHLEADPVFAVRALNHELLHAVMLRAPRFFYVHAATVAFRGSGIVLPGLSRAGKSTLALSLVMAGARFLSDELLAFDVGKKVIRAFPRAIKIRDVCLPWFGDLAGHCAGKGEGRFLPLTSLGPDVLVDHAPPKVIVAPRWDPDGDDELRSVTPGEGLLRLTSSALNFGTHRSASVDHLAALAFGSACFDLRWRDPHAAARAILEAVP